MAPLGNQNALGNKGGVKKLYTPEKLKEEARALREWIEKPDNMHLKMFAHERKYSPQRLTEFARDSTEFAEALKYAKDMQELKFMKGAWAKDMDMNFVRFFMPRMIQDRPEWKSSWDKEAEPQDQTPTVIINKISR